MNDKEKINYIEEFDIDQSYQNLKKYFELIKNHFPDYEERISQKHMIMTILKGFEEKKHSLIEAPTGTGKSMAYLLAFLSIWEQFEGKERPKFVISTRTITLQEQLITKDIPALKQMLGLDFVTELVKGRGNYICINKVKELVREDVAGFDSPSESIEFTQLLLDIGTKDGDIFIGDRNLIKKNITNELWNKISSNSDSCTGKECPHFDKCYYRKAKERRVNADILVANHSLFFADLSVRMSYGDVEDTQELDLVLPAYDFLVFDEAHHVEDVATDFLGASVTKKQLRYLISEIARSVTTGRLSDLYVQDLELQGEVLSALKVLETENEMFFSNLEIMFDQNQTSNLRLLSENKGFIDIFNYLKAFDNMVKTFKTTTSGMELDDSDTSTLNSICSRLEKFKTTIGNIVYQELENQVYWLEYSNIKGYTSIALKTCPVSVNNLLEENLFNVKPSIVLTSATMATKDMNYLAQRVGIKDYIYRILRSPFDYEKQSCIYIPPKSVNPNKSGFEDYLMHEILNLIQVTKGRTLVLFTSYKLMNSLSSYFRVKVKQMGYNFYEQGELPRNQLLEKFTEDVSSVLFATNSFWEGIDIKGESLSSVIITRLPFEITDKPVLQARMEQLEAEGRNSFYEYQIPLAVIKFKQGFGRVIRSSSDKGIVAVLDERIMTMRYGKEFLNSLPYVPITRNIEDIKQIVV